MQKYNASIYYDRAFYRHDITGSIAWARANKNRGILTTQEFNTIESGLNEVLKEWDTGIFKIVDEIDEDIHTANERRLSEIVGKASMLYKYLHHVAGSDVSAGDWRKASHR